MLGRGGSDFDYFCETQERAYGADVPRIIVTATLGFETFDQLILVQQSGATTVRIHLKKHTKKFTLSG